jgi:hypothetical protein
MYYLSATNVDMYQYCRQLKAAILFHARMVHSPNFVLHFYPDYLFSSVVPSHISWNKGKGNFSLCLTKYHAMKTSRA